MEIVDPCRISFHVVGLWPTGRVFIKSLDPQKTWEPDFETTATLRYLCISAVDRSDPESPASFVGVIRVQHEGDELQCYHSFFSDIPTEAEAEAMSAAVLRVMCSRTGHMDEVDGAERMIQNVKMLDSLGAYED